MEFWTQALLSLTGQINHSNELTKSSNDYSQSFTRILQRVVTTYVIPLAGISEKVGVEQNVSLQVILYKGIGGSWI